MSAPISLNAKIRILFIYLLGFRIEFEFGELGGDTFIAPYPSYSISDLHLYFD